MSAARPTVMVVEDEPLARERLARLIAARADFELVAVCGNGNEALPLLESAPPDVLLLDIEMPGPSGMELLRRTHASAPPPLVILTTAHAQFAIEAFAQQAVDYLLKPFDGERLDQALRAAQQRLQSRAAVQATQRIRAAIDDVPVAASSTTAHASGRLLVREQGRTKVLRKEQIDWIEADGRHCVVHCGATQFRIDGPLSRLAGELGNDSLVATSRSALVNIERIVELQELFKGNAIAILRGGAQVPVSRRFRAGVLQRLEGR